MQHAAVYFFCVFVINLGSLADLKLKAVSSTILRGSLNNDGTNGPSPLFKLVPRCEFDYIQVRV